MKQEDTGSDVTRNGDFNSSKFGIKSASDMVHIFSVLRSKLYSDKVLAVCREYATNACDAHIEAGIADRPIRITLPTHNDLFFRVRDFGKGLDDEGIREVYCMYGASTKRNSNAFNGQMGFGSKSAFAYTDFWQIDSYCNGTKTSYSVFLDESGLGEVTELTKTPTDETGIEIVIPVNYGDVGVFHSRARDLYQWFKVKPEIINSGTSIDGPSISIDLGDVKVTSTRMNDAIAVMGNVGYPIDIGRFLYDAYDQAGKNNPYRLSAQDSEWLRWRSNSLVLHFDIGELQMAASREALEYKDSTLKAIIKKLTGVKDKAIQKVKTEVLAQPTLRDALRKVNELNFITNDAISVIVNNSKINWQGKQWDERPTIDDHLFSSSVDIYRSGSRFTARPTDILSKETITPLNNNIIFLDVEKDVGIARAKWFASQNKGCAFLLIPAPTKTDAARKWMESNIPEGCWTLASSCPDPVVPDYDDQDIKPLSRPRKAPTKVDAAKRDAIYLSPNKGDHERSAKSKNWSPAELDTSKYNLIVQIESFAPKGFVENMEPRDIAICVESLISHGVLPKNTCVLGVRTSDLKQALDSGCIMLYDVLIKLRQNLEESASLYVAYENLGQSKNTIIAAKAAGAPMLFDPDNIPGKEESKKLSLLTQSQLGTMIRGGAVNCPIQNIPKQTLDACKQLFPLLKCINQWDVGNNVAALSHYMNLVLKDKGIIQ